MEHLTKEALEIELWNILPDDCKEIILPLKQTYIESLMADIDDYAAGLSAPSPSGGLPETIETLSQELSKDKSEGSYYYGWQSNIAMAFMDAVNKYAKSDKLFDEAFGDSALHEIANYAAKNFLDTHFASLPQSKVEGEDCNRSQQGEQC